MIAGENEFLCFSNELFHDKENVCVMFQFYLYSWYVLVYGNTYIVMVAKIYETDL